MAGFDLRAAAAAAGVVGLLFAISEVKPLNQAVTDLNHLGVPLKMTRGTITEVPPPLVALAKRKAVYHPVYAELAAERLGRAYPSLYSIEWLPRAGERPGYFLDAILNRRFDIVFLFLDEGPTREWGAGKHEDDFAWKLNETIRAKYAPAPPSPAISSGLAVQTDIRVYFSPGAFERRPGPDPAPWLARCFGPFRVGSLTWSIGAGGGFWCRTSQHSAVLRLVRTRARRSEVRAGGVRAGPGARIGVRLRNPGDIEVRLGKWRTHLRPSPGRHVDIALPSGASGRLSVFASGSSVADVYLGRAIGARG
jgi:hypothetical protein